MWFRTPIRARRTALALTIVTLQSLLTVATSSPAEALYLHSLPATSWANLYAGGTPIGPAFTTAKPTEKFALSKPTTITVKYSNFPEPAKVAFDAAVATWANLYASTVPITIEATWSNLSSGILGSARPGRYFQGFAGAPDKDLYYPSALANAIAGKDLDPANSEITARFSSGTLWYFGIDGKPAPGRYDLFTVVLHELCHGLGFLSSDTYDPFTGVGALDQPTAFVAFTRTIDDRRLFDLPTPSLELGRALTNALYWGGPLGIAANGGSKPKIYAPVRYDDGSSISHLDENTFPARDLNSLMSPQLDAGEVIHDPGPVATAMLEDLRNKPPAGAVTSLPSAPRNASAIVGERSAIVTFDPPADARITQVTKYEITASPGGITTSAESAPVTINNLKAGIAYTFAIRAVNTLGSGSAAFAGPITPQTIWSAKTIDLDGNAPFTATTLWRGQNVIIYSDKKSGFLKRATLIGKKWFIEIIDGNSDSNGKTTNHLDGALSTCVTGSTKTQLLHVFYTDTIEKNLRHASFDGKKWSYDIVDGNGEKIQVVEDAIRTRTASNVNVSNACVATSAGLQVFYRDDSQGILLGALLKAGTWQYELVDGDRKTDGRTTGDVAFHLAATAIGKNVHLIYDSVFTLDRDRNPTQSDVRHATRVNANPLDWKFTTLDAADARFPVVGYGVAIGAIGAKLYGAWLGGSNRGSITPFSDTLFFADITSGADPTSIANGWLGKPNLPLAIDGSNVAYACQNRLCSVPVSSLTSKLISGIDASNMKNAVWLKIDGKSGLVVGSQAGLLWLTP